jgi:hypothetical protein
MRAGTVRHNAEVLIRAAGVGARPPDDGFVIPVQFESRTFGDLDAQRFFARGIGFAL